MCLASTTHEGPDSADPHTVKADKDLVYIDHSRAVLEAQAPKYQCGHRMALARLCYDFNEVALYC